MTAFSFSCATYYGLLVLRKIKDMIAYLSQKPSHEISENHRFVGFLVPWWGGNSCCVPEICFPLIQESICGLCVNQKDSWSTFNQPTTINNADSSRFHRSNRLGELWVCWGQGFDFDSRLRLLVSLFCSLRRVQAYRLPIERPNKSISVAIFCGCNRSFGFDHGIDPSHFDSSVIAFSTGFVPPTSVGNLSGYLKEIVVSDVSFHSRHLVLYRTLFCRAGPES